MEEGVRTIGRVYDSRPAEGDRMLFASVPTFGVPGTDKVGYYTSSAKMTAGRPESRGQRVSGGRQSEIC